MLHSVKAATAEILIPPHHIQTYETFAHEAIYEVSKELTRYGKGIPADIRKPPVIGIAEIEGIPAILCWVNAFIEAGSNYALLHLENDLSFWREADHLRDGSKVWQANLGQATIPGAMIEHLRPHASSIYNAFRSASRPNAIPG
ncbi:MAG: hypothetical protein P4M15_06840 [Alphaproteobacteria bacterium]|nr:hypothetical protein [Alphaproteobacteria bacterium]